MKLKQIESLIKQRKTIIIMNSSACQWLSDGQAIYPIYNLPMLTEDYIFTMFDVPDEQRAKFFVERRSLPAHINFDDGDSTEALLDRELMTLTIRGQVLEPLKTSQGLVFIRNKYLAPFADSSNGVELYERTDRYGKVYVAVKSGFLLLGVIIPEKIISRDLVETMSRWVDLLRVAEMNGLYLSEKGKLRSRMAFAPVEEPPSGPDPVGDEQQSLEVGGEREDEDD